MKNSVKAVIVIATSAVLFGIMLPLAGGSIGSLLGSQSTVGACSTVGGGSPVGGQSTVGGQSSVCGNPTTPFIGNLPTAGAYGGRFVASVRTNGDGRKFVTSATRNVCKVGLNGVTVSEVGVGVCTLTAHVTAGATYGSANGNPQTFRVDKAVPTSPKITNLPPSATTGTSFTAVVRTTGDGTKAVTTNSSRVCRVAHNGRTVQFVRAGTCSLTAYVSTGADYLSAVGRPQTLTVGGAS